MAGERKGRGSEGGDGVRTLHRRGPGVNHLLRLASETLTQACTTHYQYLGELKIHRQEAVTGDRERGGEIEKVVEQIGQRGSAES